MDIILLQKIDNLGDLGDTVSVKGGYGRNFLIPSGRAVPATPENLQAFEARRAELEKAAAEELKKALKRAEAINGVEVVVKANAGSEGKLFGSVGPIDIADALSEIQVEVERSEIRMPDGPIGELGEFQIGVHVHSDVDAEIMVRVVAAD